MVHDSQSKAELLEEIESLRARIARLENTAARRSQPAAREPRHDPLAIFENLPDGVLIADARTRKFLWANKQIGRMLNTPPENIAGLSVMDVHPADSLPQVSEYFEKHLQEGLDFVADIPVMRKDGSVFYADINAFAIHLDGRQYIVGIFKDRTDTRKLDQRLRKSEAATRAILDATTESVLLVDADRTVLAINKMSARRFGGSPEEMIGRDVGELLHKTMVEEAADARLAQFSAVVSSGQPVTFEDKRGGQHFENNLFPILDDAGNVSAVAIFARDITEQKNVEEELRSRQAYMKALLDATTESVLLVDPTGKILSMNRTAAERFGCRADELIGTDGKDLVRSNMPSQSAADRLAQFEKVLRTGEPVRMEDRRAERTFDTNMYPVLDAAGGVSSVVIFARDITEQKKARRALEKSEAWHRSLIELGATVYTVLDADGNVIYESPSVRRVYGWDPEDIVGESVFDHLHPDDVPYAKKRFNELLATSGTIEQAEIRYIHKDGRCLTINIAGVNLLDEPTVRGVILTSHDITHRKELEEAVARSERKYRTLVEGAGESIVTLDAEGTFLFVNSTGAGRLNTTPDRMVGRTMWDFFPDDIADRQVSRIRAVMESGKGETVTTLTDVRGDKRWYQTTIEPLRDAEGKVEAALVIARDIHEGKQAQLELAELQQHMAQAQRLASLGTIGATLAHRITQPLTAVTLSIENAAAQLQTVKTPPAVFRNLDSGLEGAAQISAIIDNLRMLARSIGRTDAEEIHIDRIIDDVFQLLADTARDADVLLQKDRLDHLPPVLAPRFEIEQVFYALIQNAIQAADGSRSHQVTLRGSKTERNVKIECIDDCGGVPPEVEDKLFEPFFTTKPPGRNTGLGLSIAEQIIARVGGSITLENKPSKGAAFIVLLPLPPEEIAERKE